MYSANLALLYGAKWLSLYGYIAQVDTLSCDSGQLCHAMVDILPSGGGLHYTDKWNMWKNTLKPRLIGLFGKTIKTLEPTDHSLGTDAINQPIINKNFVDKVQSTGGSSDTCFVDVGFFNDPSDGDKKYFMLLNRYYSDQQSMNIYFQGLTTYKNWEVTDFMDTSKVTIEANQDTASMADVIPKGDGKLYSVLPVVKYGGKLSYSEIIGSETIFGEVNIQSGKTLTINNNSTITLAGDGFITGAGTLTLGSSFTLDISSWQKRTSKIQFIKPSETCLGNSSNLSKYL